ncbi:hypothetical protein Tco_0827664 [Tanacetum coccineum]
MEANRFTNTSVDEIGIDDSSRYPPDEFLYTVVFASYVRQSMLSTQVHLLVLQLGLDGRKSINTLYFAKQINWRSGEACFTRKLNQFHMKLKVGRSLFYPMEIIAIAPQIVVFSEITQELNDEDLKLLALLSSLMYHILKGDIELHFILTEYQLADIFIKPLDEPTFFKLKA